MLPQALCLADLLGCGLFVLQTQHNKLQKSLIQEAEQEHMCTTLFVYLHFVCYEPSQTTSPGSFELPGPNCLPSIKVNMASKDQAPQRSIYKTI
jgi:hypothetical protein